MVGFIWNTSRVYQYDNPHLNEEATGRFRKRRPNAITMWRGVRRRCRYAEREGLTSQTTWQNQDGRQTYTSNGVSDLRWFTPKQPNLRLTQESLRMVTARVLAVLSGSFTSQIETGPILTWFSDSRCSQCWEPDFYITTAGTGGSNPCGRRQRRGRRMW